MNEDKRGDATRGIPKLRCLVILEYYLGVPWASPSLGSCHSLFHSPSDRGKGVPSFDEMVDFALVEVDFDDPTTNVRGRRALAIAKPTPRGY